MRKIFLLLIILIITPLTNAQYKIDWANAPMNPIKDIYTLDHFNIRGKVISRNNGMTTHFFNDKGFLTEVESFVNVKYEYNAKGHLKTIRSAQSKSEFICDNQGRIINQIMEDGGGYKYTYNEKGLWTRSQDLKTGDVESNFIYDSPGRIIKDEFYDKGKLYKTSTYAYTNTGNDLEVKVTQVQDGKTTTFINKYNKRGDCTYTNSKTRILTYDQENNIRSISGGSVPIVFVYEYKRSLIDWDAAAKNDCQSGDCENGYGSKIFGDKTYIGFFKNGKQDGPGFFGKKNYSFVSSWKNGLNSGYGQLTDLDADHVAQGYFENMKLNGKGLQKLDGKFQYGNFVAGNLVSPPFKFENNNVKIGCAVGDCFNQYGKYNFKNGTTLLGFFKDYVPEFGLFTENKNEYNGEFYDGKRGGFGWQNFDNGDSYYGYFANGKRHGKGLYLSKGNPSIKFMGIWENDKLIKDLNPTPGNQNLIQPTPLRPEFKKTNSTQTPEITAPKSTQNVQTEKTLQPKTQEKYRDLGFGNAAPDLNKMTFKKTLENMYPGYPNKDKKFLAIRIEELAAVKTTDAEKVKFIAERVEDIIPINKYEAFQVIMNIQQKFQLPVLKYLTPEFRQYVKAEAQKFVDDYYKQHPMR